MFSYCLNNPVMYSDPTGRYTFIGTELDQNEEEDELEDWHKLELGASPHPINGQRVCEYANSRFGLTTVAKSGCAVIATYNAINLKGYIYSFDDCLKEYNKLRPSTRILGVAPHEIDYVL